MLDASHRNRVLADTHHFSFSLSLSHPTSFRCYQIVRLTLLPAGRTVTQDPFSLYCRFLSNIIIYKRARHDSCRPYLVGTKIYYPFDSLYWSRHRPVSDRYPTVIDNAGSLLTFLACDDDNDDDDDFCHTWMSSGISVCIRTMRASAYNGTIAQSSLNEYKTKANLNARAMKQECYTVGAKVPRDTYRLDL